MKSKKIVRVGILGCGAIGSRIAQSVRVVSGGRARVSAVYDIDPSKVAALAKALRSPSSAVSSYHDLLVSCDILVEAIASDATVALVREAVLAGKDVLAMSVGRFLKAQALIRLAEERGIRLIFPSGAIAGVDALKSASIGRVRRVTLTTIKPLDGFRRNSYIVARRISLEGVDKDTVIFEGRVEDAVKHFPQNINVAATLALACGDPAKIRVRLIASPTVRRNTHEVVFEGDFGRCVTRTENVPCPDNPKTSLLAALSGLAALAGMFRSTRVGT